MRLFFLKPFLFLFHRKEFDLVMRLFFVKPYVLLILYAHDLRSGGCSDGVNLYCVKNLCVFHSLCPQSSGYSVGMNLYLLTFFTFYAHDFQETNRLKVWFLFLIIYVYLYHDFQEINRLKAWFLCLYNLWAFAPWFPEKKLIRRLDFIPYRLCVFIPWCFEDGSRSRGGNFILLGSMFCATNRSRVRELFPYLFFNSVICARFQKSSFNLEFDFLWICSFAIDECFWCS